MAAKAGCEGSGVEGPEEVALTGERDNAISDLEAGDPGACGDDGAGGIGAWNQGGLLLTSWVGALRDMGIMIMIAEERRDSSISAVRAWDDAV